MTKREIASLALKIVGIYAVIQGLTQMAHLTTSPFLRLPIEDAGIDPSRVLPWFLFWTSPALLMCLIGCILIVFSRALSRWMYREPDEEPHGAYAASGLHAMAFAVVGAFLAAQSLPVLLSYAWMCISSWSEGSETISRQPFLVTMLLSAALKLLAGLGLFFGGGWTARFWRRLGTANGGTEAGQTNR